MSSLESLHASYEKAFPGKLSVRPVFRGETTWVVEKDCLLRVMEALRRDGFDYLVDVSSVDNFGQHPRFEMVYELMNLGSGDHLRVKVPVAEDETVPSVSALWRTANWHEREVYDMMGLRFDGHPDLRRILMWEGYPYHPLRKEFPLEGKPTELPDIAFTRAAPLEGGPFVTAPASNTQDREPRSRHPETLNP